MKNKPNSFYRFLLPPQVIDCDTRAKSKLMEFYRIGYSHAKLAQIYLQSLLKEDLRTQVRIWNEDKSICKKRGTDFESASFWFGQFSLEKLEYITFVFESVVQRFEKGFYLGEKFAPTKIKCLTNKQQRCNQGVLANAAEFGTIRVCPRLLNKSDIYGGLVILHELLHQKLGVGDQRDLVCKRGEESRCYRTGARKLIVNDKIVKAMKNNDNYVLFSKSIYNSCVEN